jgi:hypothetical protein
MDDESSMSMEMKDIPDEDGVENVMPEHEHSHN